MPTLPKVEFQNSAVAVDLGDQGHSMEVIRQLVIQSILDKNEFLNKSNIKFRKITKNDNIKQTIEKLEKNNIVEEVQCLYSYGAHLQKMLSVLEIYKKVMERSSMKLEQYNKLTCFVTVEEGRNVLLEKKTRVPIMIVFIVDEKNVSLPRDLLTEKGFTRQV